MIYFAIPIFLELNASALASFPHLQYISSMYMRVNIFLFEQQESILWHFCILSSIDVFFYSMGCLIQRPQQINTSLIIIHDGWELLTCGFIISSLFGPIDFHSRQLYSPPSGISCMVPKLSSIDLKRSQVM